MHIKLYWLFPELLISTLRTVQATSLHTLVGYVRMCVHVRTHFCYIRHVSTPDRWEENNAAALLALVKKCNVTALWGRRFRDCI